MSQIDYNKYYLKSVAADPETGWTKDWAEVTRTEYMTAQAAAGIAGDVPSEQFSNGYIRGKVVHTERLPVG